MARRGRRQDRRGVTAIEYSLIGALVFLAIVGSIKTFASAETGVFTQVSSAINPVLSR